MPAHRKWSVDYTFQGRGREKIPLILKVKDMYARGLKPKAIQEETGLSKTTVFRYINAPVDGNTLRKHTRKTKPGPKMIANQPKIIPKVRKVDNPVEFIESNDLLGIKMFPMQRLIIKCFYGLDLNEDERKVLARLEKEGRTTYKGQKRYRELVVNAGMKGGKTPLAGFINCWEEYELFKLGDPAKHYGFLPGKEIYILNVAVNADQAQMTIFAEIKARIHYSNYYRLHRPTDSTETQYKFSNNVIIRSGHSNSSSLVGKTAKVVDFDELARFIDKGGKYSAERVYYSLIRSVEPFKEDGKIVDISSPMFQEDMICRLYNSSKEINNMLGFWLPTWEMNPGLPFESELMQSELKKNPEAFWRDFGAQPSASSEAYYKVPEKIDQCILNSTKESPVDSSGRLKQWFKGDRERRYVMHADPSVRNDAYGLALGHLEGSKTVIDLATRFVPPEGYEIDLNEVKAFILEIIKRGFRIKIFSYDTWQAAHITQELERRGVKVKNKYVLKTEHDYLKELIYSGKLIISKNEVLVRELKQLELIHGGKVDHSPNGSKDIADAVAGTAYTLMSENVHRKLIIPEII
jgi:hypothetical protein